MTTQTFEATTLAFIDALETMPHNNDRKHLAATLSTYIYNAGVLNSEIMDRLCDVITPERKAKMEAMRAEEQA